MRKIESAMEQTCAAHAMQWSNQLEMALRFPKPGISVKAILEMEPHLSQWSREPESSIASNAVFGLVPGEDKLFANAILLRLADAFRRGDIETRLSVVKVFISEKRHRRNKKQKQCKGLLSEARVANHLELLKRVKSVFDGEDLKSRALALVLFGCWADFAKDNAQIRYMILSSLVSPHDFMVRASLYATGCFCEISDEFASIAVEMLFNIMNSSSVSLLVKLAAARGLAKCRSSFSVAHRAYKTGMEFVLNSPDEDILVTILFSLTKLASILVVHNSYQVGFLLSFLNRERASRVQETALKCLHFLFEKTPCLHQVNSDLVQMLFSTMEEPALQYKALKVLHKVLLPIPPLLHVELCEFVKLLNVVENTSQSFSCLAIRVLADLCCRTVDKADIESGVFRSSSLPSRVICLIKDHIKLLVMPLLEACQNDLTICQDLQGLLKVLLLIVESHPYLGSLALDNIKVVIEYLVSVGSTDRAVSSSLVVVHLSVEKNKTFISKVLRKIYRFLVAFLENIYNSGAINTEVLDRVKILAELVCQCNLIDCYTYTMYHLLLHSRLIGDGLVCESEETQDYLSRRSESCLTKCPEFVNKVLKGTDGWTAYKIGAHTACQGEWLLATAIFKTLIEKVKSDSYCSWLNALFNYAHSEGKFQLLSVPPNQGIISVELLKSIKFPLTACDYMDETCPRLVGFINDCNYYDEQLTQSHVALCSSLKILEACMESSQAFCFQRWFFSLRSRVLENLVDLFKALREFSLNKDWNFNQVAVESSNKLQCLKSCKDISRTSFQLCRLAEEFDLFRRSFIDMDSESSAVLGAHGLSCSVLAFVSAFGVSNIDQHSHGVYVGDITSCNLQVLTIQHLMSQLWSVDHEIRASLSLLLNYFDQHKNCLSMLPGYLTWNFGHKDRVVLEVCTYAVSGAVGLHNERTERTAPQVTENALLLTLCTLIKWMHMHFQIPRFFFKVRQVAGSELFVHNGDSGNGVHISILPSFHLSLNLCVQLKNVSPNLLAKSTKLYCILHCSTASAPDGQTMGFSQSRYDPWRDDEIVELNKKLFGHVLNSMAGEKTKGMQNRGNGNMVVEAFLKFEPNEKGQGFAHCTLDVSRFPVGSYRMKWHSCLVDDKDSYWSLLPLNLGPVFVINPMVG